MQKLHMTKATIPLLAKSHPNSNVIEIMRENLNKNNKQTTNAYAVKYFSLTKLANPWPKVLSDVQKPVVARVVLATLLRDSITPPI